LAVTLVLVGCRRGKGPTPVPTLPNVTVVPITATPSGAKEVLPQVVEATPVPPTPVPEQVTIGATPASTQPRVEVVVNEAKAYNGPGTHYVFIGTTRAGQQLSVESRSPDGQWILACCLEGRTGWIALKDVRPLTDISGVPVDESVLTSPLDSPLPSE